MSVYAHFLNNLKNCCPKKNIGIVLHNMIFPSVAAVDFSRDLDRGASGEPVD
mgnify:CR=1 FL=1